MSWFNCLFKNRSNSVTVNGTTYLADKSITINGNKVVIDGNTFITDGPIINAVIHGDCEEVSSDNGDITIEGNSGSAQSKNGNIRVGGNINGDAETKNGNIHAKGIARKASTINGDIRR